MSYQTLLNNYTPFSAEHFVLPDQEGQEVLLLVVVATFEAVSSDSPLQLAAVQTPVYAIEEYYGDPTNSSIRYESNLALEKPFVDVLLNAHAYAPGGKSAEKVIVGIQVGDIRKSLLVQGDRQWVPGPLRKSPSHPKRFLKMPIIYERAFGGFDNLTSTSSKRRFEPRNPIGVGFIGIPSHDPDIHTEVPNVEYPHERMHSHRDRPTPAGFGAISRNWKPRIDYAGTYDANWLNEHWPLLPVDFDSRFNQAAPPDQQSQKLKGGETVKLINLTPTGLWQFKLPQLNTPVHLIYNDRHRQANLRLDTVLIEPDLYRVTLTSRLKLRLQRNQSILYEIVLGHMYPGWLRARVTGKRYIDRQSTKGINPNCRDFHL